LVVSTVTKLQGQQPAESEVAAKISDFWLKKVTTCGELMVAKNVDGDWKVMRGAQWTIEPGRVTQADALNGVQWQGVTRLTASSSRNWVASDRSFRAWQNGLGFGFYDVRVVKKNGSWTFTLNTGGSPIENMIAPRCADIPNEPTAAEQQSAMSNERQRLCEKALRLGLGDTSAFARQAGSDSNSCRDTQGRTLLMVNLNRRPLGWESGADALIKSGADLNVKDNSGWSALRYAVRARKADAAFPDAVRSVDDVIRQLIARGADPEDLVDSQGRVR
jgi:hypothetical protein